MYKVGLMGATGRMGIEIAALLREDKELELADAVSATRRYRSVEGVEVRKPEEPAREAVHVWIDFSVPAATMQLLEETTCPVVIGTTGLSDAQKAAVLKHTETRAILLASNTSPGMAVIRNWLRALPSAGTLAWDVVLEETHHRHKKDAPSGTAKSLLDILKDRGFAKPEVHVTRAGEVIGTHTIRLLSDDEEIIISHRATRREVFAKGALVAARFLLDRAPGLYSMDDIFKRGDA